MGDPGDHGLTRQLGAVQKEQQGDGQLDDDVQPLRRLAAHGQDRGQHDHAEQSDDVGLDLQLIEQALETHGQNPRPARFERDEGYVTR